MAKNPKIIEITQGYFTFEVEAWDAEEERIELPINTNLENILKQLESGANLFETIPGLSKNRFLNFPLKYAKLETISQIKKNGKIFSLDEPYEQVGKLLIPHYLILTRQEIKEKLLQTTNIHDEKTYCTTLLNLLTPEFYHHGVFDYRPFNTNNALKLSKNQLS